MEKHVFETKSKMGAAAAGYVADKIQQALQEKGQANIVLATGASQIDTLNYLVQAAIDWTNVNVFHLDEYMGIPDTHPASSRKYIKDRFISQVGTLKSINFIEGQAEDVHAERQRLGELIARHPIDVLLVGIGENGQLVSNGVPADFDADEPYIVSAMDIFCRRQQVDEGWFNDLDEVPQQEITMSIRQILKSKTIVVSVPDQRKAKAVRGALFGEISPMRPASILQTHHHCAIFMDRPAASLLSPR